MKSFKISVIIPVYNAEKYLRKSVESAVILEEVGEIILIEDASPDNALTICRELAAKYDKVKLFRHPNGENRGAGASRNLGMVKATCDYVAFLDADDWYLPNRFTKTSKAFQNTNVQGVYEPVGTFFYDEVGFLFGENRKKEEGEKIITQIDKIIPPENLFRYLLAPNYGIFHTNGVTLKKAFIKDVGGFSSQLKLHQDSEFWLRCAYLGNLIAPKDPEVVSIRGVHHENRIKNKNFKSKSLLYETIYKYYRGKNISLKEKLLIFKKAVYFDKGRRHLNSSRIRKYGELIKIGINHFPIFYVSRKK